MRKAFVSGDTESVCYLIVPEREGDHKLEWTAPERPLNELQAGCTRAGKPGLQASMD